MRIGWFNLGRNYERIINGFVEGIKIYRYLVLPRKIFYLNMNILLLFLISNSIVLSKVLWRFFPIVLPAN